MAILRLVIGWFVADMKELSRSSAEETRSKYAVERMTVETPNIQLP